MIHIKEKNKGKFTEAAKAHGMGVQEYARKVVNDPSSTKLQKKRAQFALNAKKFKHQDGTKFVAKQDNLRVQFPTIIDQNRNSTIPTAYGVPVTFYPEGSFIRVDGDPQYRLVSHSDRTLYPVGYGDSEYSVINAPADVRNYTTRLIYNKKHRPEYGTDLPEDMRQTVYDRQEELLGRESEFFIPLGVNNKIRFSSKEGIVDRLNGLTTEPQVLDSIAFNVGRYNKAHPNRPISIENALGIALNESSLASNSSGRRSVLYGTPIFGDNKWQWIKTNKDFISPVTMNSSWISYRSNKINSYMDAAEHYARILNSEGKEAADNWWKDNKSYFDSLRDKEINASDWNPYFPLYDLFLEEDSKGNSKANPGEPGYKEKILEFGKSLMSTKTGKDWWQTSGQKAYNKGYE